MTDFSRMTPVAQVHYLSRQVATLQDALKSAALKNFKLKQEVTGGLQVVWALANQQPDKKLVIPAAELVTAMGSLQRSRNEETDTYTFEALQPTDEQHEKLAKEIVGVTDDAPAAETPRAEFSATGTVVES